MISEQILSAPSLLVAMPQLQDPNFRQAVILLVEHNSEGALGFVCNKIGKIPLRDILIDSDLDVPGHIPTWASGPVGVDNGLILRSAEPQDKDSEEAIGADLVLSSSQESLARLVDHCRDPEADTSDKETNLYPYRFLVGYAGWGAKQLDNELRQNSWIQLPLDNKLLFQTPREQMWDVAIASLGVHPAEITAVTQDFLN